MFKSKFGKIKIAIVELIFEKTQSKFEIQCIGRSTKSWGTPPLCDFVHAIFGLSAHRFWIQLVVPSQALSTNTFQCFCCISQKLLRWSVQKNWIEQQKYQNPNMGFKVCPKFHPNFESGLRSWKIEIWIFEVWNMQFQCQRFESNFEPRFEALKFKVWKFEWWKCWQHLFVEQLFSVLQYHFKNVGFNRCLPNFKLPSALIFKSGAISSEILA